MFSTSVTQLTTNYYNLTRLKKRNDYANGFVLMESFLLILFFCLIFDSDRYASLILTVYITFLLVCVLFELWYLENLFDLCFLYLLESYVSIVVFLHHAHDDGDDGVDDYHDDGDDDDDYQYGDGDDGDY